MLCIFNNEIANTDLSIHFKAILKMWVNKFEENSLIGTMKLLTVVINCFDVDICNNVIIDLNLVSMISKITECFKILVFMLFRIYRILNYAHYNLFF